MVNVRELSESEQVAMKHSSHTGLSYAEIGRQISRSVTFKFFTKFELAGSVEER